MEKILSIIKREYLQIVRTKGFIISTILGPILMAAILGIPIIAALATTGEKKRIEVIDASGEIFTGLERKLDSKMKDGSRRYELRNILASGNLNELRATLGRKVLAKEISAYIYVPRTILEGGEAEYVSQHVSDFDQIERIKEALNSVIIERRMNKEGLNPERVAQLMKRVSLKTIKVTSKGEEEDRGGTFAIAYFLGLVIYMSMFGYGAIIMRGVIEEKNNRVVEIVISSVKPFQLMMGKLLGIAAVGFTQYIIWALFGLAATTYAGSFIGSLAPARSGFKIGTIPPYIFVYFVVFFILGYFLYASFYAAVGSMVNSEKEAQQLLTPVTMLLILPVLLMMLVMRSPNSPLSVVLSLIPFFAPILMMMRICVLLPSFLQILASISFLFLGIIFMVWLTSKIYRVGILMYGKPPRPREILKWIRYK